MVGEAESAEFSEYQALVRRLEDEKRARESGQRVLLRRVSEMHQQLSAGNSEIWRVQRDGIKDVNDRLDRLEGVLARSLGRIEFLDGTIRSRTETDREQTDHLSRIDVSIGTLVGRLDEMGRRPRIKSAFWGAVGAPAALIVMGLASWVLRHFQINVGWP